MWDKLETILLFFTTYHPQIESQTEMVNTTLTQLLKTIIQKKTLKIKKNCLSFNVFAYIIGVHSTIKFSPFKIVYDFNHLTPLDLLS